MAALLGTAYVLPGPTSRTRPIGVGHGEGVGAGDGVGAGEGVGAAEGAAVPPPPPQALTPQPMQTQKRIAEALRLLTKQVLQSNGHRRACGKSALASDDRRLSCGHLPTVGRVRMDGECAKSVYCWKSP